MLACVIGDPVHHSLSPVIHNAAFAARGLDWVYVALRVPSDRLAPAVHGLRALDVGGVSVTMPHKEAVIAHLDGLSADAEALTAVNCLVPEGSRLVGHNTDGAGFVAGLRSSGATGVRSLGGRAVVLGTGGAARAVARAVALGDAEEVRLVSRDPSRSLAAAEMLAATSGSAIRSGSLADVAQADLIVNATPVGMTDHPGEPCPSESLRPGAVAVDLVYHPLETAWLRACRRRGIEAMNGLPMLVHQAALAFSLWTGTAAPVPAMEAAVRRHLDGDPPPSD